MTIQKIVPKSEESLKPCENVSNIKDKYIQQAIQDLLDTLANKQRELDAKQPGTGRGVGLASNQIEYPYEPTSEDDPTPKEGSYPKGFAPKMYVISIRSERAGLEENCKMLEPTVFINATFTPTSDEMTYVDEGCLSINGITALKVPRYKFGTVNAYNKEGKKIELPVEGFHARVHQHEFDHCKGEEFLNRMGFTLEELSIMRVWIRRAKGGEKSATIVEEKLICSDLENVDVTAFSVWVENEVMKRQLQGRFGEGIDLSLLGGEKPQEVPKPRAVGSVTRSFVN